MGKAEKKKILVLNYEFPPLGGGAANATYYLLKEFSKDKNLEIDLVTSSVDEFKIEQFANNITIHYLDIGKKGNLHYQSNKDLLSYSSKALKYSKELTKKNDFDLVHAFFGIPCGYLAMKLKNKFGVPYIVSLRGSDVPFYNKRFYWLDLFVFKRLSKKIWKNAKAVIANSEELKKLANNTSKKQDISVIYNGVYCEEFKPVNNKPKNDKLILISTGRLIERKGYEYAIKAISGMKDVELRLVGDGNLKNELEKQSKDLNSNVKFLGKKDKKEIVSLLQQADIFILPSLNEGMSNSILEAMAVGLPIITTDTGGTMELIKDNGFVVSKKSDVEIVGVIKKYINDENLLKSHSIKSRELANQLGWDTMMEGYKSVYYV